MPILHAYIDEAGQRSRSAKSSDHFVMSAVLVPDDDLPRAAAMLAQLRLDLKRRPGDVLHWRNLKGHSMKLHVAQTIGAADYLGVCTVVVCKRHLNDVGMSEDAAYLFTLRFLLERLSWAARDYGYTLSYTLAHIVRFKKGRLREYEAALRAQPESMCKIAWPAMDPKGGRLEQPQRVEMLQLADAVASATFAAFEPDTYGNTETRYLQEFDQRMWRRGNGQNRLTSYGLKMHPWNDNTKAAYPWVAAL